MSIDPGAYTIRNVMHQNLATQSWESKVEAYAQSLQPSVRDVTTCNGERNLQKLWSISRLDNDKYTIRNIETGNYAASSNFPAINENIITTQDLQPWDIKETGFKGRYVIYTTAASIDLFWGLTNGQLSTLISLRDTPNTPSNQWEITKVDSWKVVGTLRAKLSGLQNLATTLPGELQKLQDNYTKLHGEHTELQDNCMKLQDEHMKLQVKYAELQDECTKLQDEHAKLQDKHTKLSDGFGLLNADAQQERARHVQTETELKAFYERRSRRDEARRLQADAELRASYERASRQERARQLQAEAELKAHYEKLLAEEVRRAEKWRCVCM